MTTANVTAQQVSAAAATASFYGVPDHAEGATLAPGNVDTEYSLCFGPYQLFPRQRLLLREGQPLQVGSKALEILIVLAERRGDVVSKNDLMARVWPGVTVEENGLRVHVAGLRKALWDWWHEHEGSWEK